jgi:hypothetical protein
MAQVLDKKDRILLSQQLDIDLQEDDSLKMLKNKLSDKLNYLIEQDFNALVHLLYRIDISEVKLKQTLQENEEKDAGKLIAEMIIQRQMEKAELRKKFNRQDEDIEEEDKW